jgi:hypothetical protein
VNDPVQELSKEQAMQRVQLWVMLAILTLALAACSGGGGVTPPPSDNFTRLTAQVTDGSGKPLDNLTVRVEGQATGVTTDSTGAFILEKSAFPNGVAATNELSFGRNGVIMGTYEVVPASNPSVVIKFGSADPGTETGGVSGMVYNVETQAPLSGVELSLFSEDGGVYSATSGSDGYSFTDIPAGNWSLAASMAGYYSEMAVVQVSAGDTTIQHLAMTPNGSVNPGQGVLVHGTLKDSETNAPIAGATVTMYCDTGYMYPCYDDVANDVIGGGTTEPGTPRGASMAPYMYDPSYQETTTDANGEFAFEQEVVGYYIWLNYYADGYLNGDHNEDINGQSGELALDLTMESYVETSASGVITDDAGNPIPGAYIELVFAGEMLGDDPVAMPGSGIDWVGMINEKGNGDFNAPAPPMMPGVDGADWGDIATGDADNGQGSAGSPSVDNEVMMRFRWENQQNGDHGASQVAGFNGYFSTNADENGAFSFEGMPAGDYYMFASAYRHLPVNEVMTVAEDASLNVFEIALEPVPVGVVEGVVTDENGDPIADCLVNATQPNVDPFTYTDETGHFRIENVPAGTWFISGYKTGYLTESVEQVIIEDQTVVVNLALETYTAPTTDLVAFGGQIINGTDATKLAGVDIVFTPVDNTLGGYYQHVVSNETGAFSCQLVATEYNVLLQKEGYEDVFIRIWVDSEYPTMDFWMWPINSGNGGPWGGWLVPMMEGENGAETPDMNDGDMPADMPMMPRM